MPHLGLLAPRYDDGGLAGVLPGVATSLGVPGLDLVPSVPMRPARRAVVVLVDGLGYELVRRRGGHAPFLRSLLPAAYRITAGFPSTTATSMGTFGTGQPPGAHGLLGYEVLVPGEDRLVNELSWEDGPDPLAWQPEPTVFELAQRDGVDVTATPSADARSKTVSWVCQVRGSGPSSHDSSLSRRSSPGTRTS